MLKIAVTGNIGSGKSTIMQMLLEMGEIVFDADAEIRNIYLNNTDFYEQIKLLNKDYVKDNKILKEKIITDLSQDSSLLLKLEYLLYPILQEKRLNFLFQKQKEKLWAVFFEIPLLFEKKLENEYDKVILLYASKEIRLERVLHRHNMSKEKFEYLNNLQIESNKVINKVYFSINTEDDFISIKEKLSRLIQELKG